MNMTSLLKELGEISTSVGSLRLDLEYMEHYLNQQSILLDTLIEIMYGPTREKQAIKSNTLDSTTIENSEDG